MKPIALVDMDGPLADFDKQFWQLCRDAGFAMDCDEGEQTARFATDHVLDDSERRFARRFVNTYPRWFHDLPVVDGAVEGINELTDHFDVYICTKPLEANKRCRDGKAEWVRTHLGADWEQRLIITPDKSVVMGAVLLDDAIKLEWLQRAVWNPVCFPTCFNGAGSRWEHLPRWGWGDGVDRLLGLAEAF